MRASKQPKRDTIRERDRVAGVVGEDPRPHGPNDEPEPSASTSEVELQEIEAHLRELGYID